MPEERIEKMKEELKLLDISDVMQLTGWGEATVREVMSEDEFPVVKIGKNNQVSFDALKEYLSHRRIRRGK